MTAHRLRLGGVLRGVGSAAGVGLAVVGLVAQPGVALGGVVVGVVVGGGMAIRLRDRPTADRGAARRSAIKAGAAALWLWLIAGGLIALLGWSVESALIALLLLAIPATLHLRRRFATAEAPAPTAPPTALVPFPVVGSLSTPDLCHAWRQSYLTLVDLPAGPDRSELVAVRQAILDELEGRDAAGFGRWLEAGARAGSDPGRYLATGRGA